jgi:hypothetical protein
VVQVWSHSVRTGITRSAGRDVWGAVFSSPRLPFTDELTHLGDEAKLPRDALRSCHYCDSGIGCRQWPHHSTHEATYALLRLYSTLSQYCTGGAGRSAKAGNRLGQQDRPFTEGASNREGACEAIPRGTTLGA